MKDILVVGAGPVGLTLAAELARHGVRCRIVDRLAQPSPYCRAIGVTPRTLELWEAMGIAREMIDAGLWLEGDRSIVNGRQSDDSREDFPELPYGALGLPQYATERVLARHLAAFGVEVERGVSLIALNQDENGVTTRLADLNDNAVDWKFAYVIGCDGAHSAVRHAVGIGFAGDAMPLTFMLGDVQIAWDLPRGFTFRALRLPEAGPPDLFVAIPLPDPGRYRVTMLAPPAFLQPGSTEHGIQSEASGPGLADLQAVADRLVPGRPGLSDLRWSSIFRISMRLAERYRQGRVFIAGDAAHIHPPTGGQGMNTGIQDACNLAWKLALVVNRAAPASLLDSYEAERRPVGVEVVARTRAATERYGREPAGKPRDRANEWLANTQIGVSYRGTGWVRDDAPELDAVPDPGDRAPDAGGLRRQGIGFPLRLFDLLRGTDHVLVAHLPGADARDGVADLVAWAQASRAPLRIVAVVAGDGIPDQPGVAVLRDPEGAFAGAYGASAATFLVRPDGHIGWRGPSWRHPGLPLYLAAVLRQPRG